MSACPRVSIIINTDGRAAILGNTIESLRYLRYPNLELVVVPVSYTHLTLPTTERV